MLISVMKIFLYVNCYMNKYKIFEIIEPNNITHL